MWDWCKDDWDHPMVAENNKPGFKTVNQDYIFIRFKKLLPRLDDSYAQWWFKTSESGVRLAGLQSELYPLFTWVSQFNGLNLSLPIKWNGNTWGITCLEAWIRSCGESVYSNAWCINGFPWWLGILLPMQEKWVRFLSREDPLEMELANHSSFLAWEIPGTGKPGSPWGHKELVMT